MFRRIALWSVACALAATPAIALAQSKYPFKPVTIVVPYPPSGSNDIFARAVAKNLGEALGQPFVVENRPGASGMLGANLVSKAPPDGYTIMLLSSSFTTGAAVAESLPFDPVKGFAPIAMIARGPMILTVATAKPIRNLAELMAYAKANPGKLNYASSGAGSTNQFAPELPALAQSGLPGYRFDLWWGMLAPAGTPPEIVARLNAEVNKALATPEMREMILREGAEAAPLGVAEFAATVESEIANWRRVAKQANIKVE